MSVFSTLFGRGRRAHGWQAVSTWVDDDEADDELMRMALEDDSSYPQPNLDNNYSDVHTDSAPVFSQFNQSHNQSSAQRLCCARCECELQVGEKSSPCLLILSIFVLLAVTGLSAGLGYYSLFVKKPEPVIDKSIEAFSIPNDDAYIHYDAFMLARKNNASQRFRRDVSGTDALPVSSLHSELTNNREKRSNMKNYKVESRIQVIVRWKMHVIYLAQGDKENNIFTNERLQTVHKIENDIISHPRFEEFCYRDPQAQDPLLEDRNECAPLNSLLSYFFPSLDSQGNVYYDGFGKNLDDIDSALNLAMSEDTFYYFVDENINKTFKKSRLMRTEVLFGAPLPGYNSLRDHTQEQTDQFKEFIITYIDLLSKASTEKVHVLYGGNELFDYEVESTFWSDVRMAVYTCIAIAVFMFILTSFSFYLTILGIWCIVLSFPLAFFFYRVVFNIVALGILNGAAAFVIIGIGVDDVFVFINIFRQSSHIKPVNSRLLYTIRTAGVATFLTSFTTAVAFAANIASSIPAVYEFGLFMSLIVSCCWLTVFFLMPPILYIYVSWIEPLEKMCAGLCCRCIQKRNTGMLDGEQVRDVQRTLHIVTDTSDVPLLQMENNEFAHGEDDVPMLVPEQEQTIVMTNQTLPSDSSIMNIASSSYIGRCQQYVLGIFIDKVVIRLRVPIIVFFVLLVGISIGLMTQLRPADHPPQLFHPDTNLQRLLDLKANFSIIDTLNCDRCSALYKVNVNRNTGNPVVQPPPTRPLPSVSNDTWVNVIPHLTPSNTKTEAPSGGRESYTSPWIHPLITTTQKPRFLTTTNKKTTTSPTTTTSTTTTTTTTTTTAARHHPIPTAPKVPPNQQKVNSVAEGFDACQNHSCNGIKDRPILQSGATVYVVFGIKGIDRSEMQAGHVLTQFRGNVIFDDRFSSEVGLINNFNLTHLKDLCRICHLLASNTELVKNGSAQCLPYALPDFVTKIVYNIEECRNLPRSLTIYQHEAPAHAEASISQENKLIWLAFAFESTVSKAGGYFEAYQYYLKWEKVIKDIRENLLSSDSPLSSLFQTSEFWTKVLMEVVAVNSAIYSLVFSLVVCVVTVAIFTGHAVLLFIIFIAIAAMVCAVVGTFYMAGWQMGAVEAVSLSILVGSSVDYCMHLVEGYLVVGKHLPPNLILTPGDARRWRTSAAIQHIGASIVSSALTTIIAAVPLTQTTIQPFAKFGTIVLINSTVSIVFTLTLCVALLATMAPARFCSTWRSHIIAMVSTAAVCGFVVLVMFVCSVTGIMIPGPNGKPLFS